MFDESSFYELISFLVYTLTDAVPIGLMMYYHRSNFRTLAVQREVNEQQSPQ